MEHQIMTPRKGQKDTLIDPFPIVVVKFYLHEENNLSTKDKIVQLGTHKHT